MIDMKALGRFAKQRRQQLMMDCPTMPDSMRRGIVRRETMRKARMMAKKQQRREAIWAQSETLT